ncbi:MAG: hypothetical protein V2G42_03545 [bacterium JZ-2024 1]
MSATHSVKTVCSGTPILRASVYAIILLGSVLPRPASAQLVAVDFWAKNAVISEETDEHFGWGGARATFSDTTIEADAMILQKDQGRLIAQGHVRMARPGIGVYAEQIVFDFATGFFQMSYPKGFFVVEAAPKDLFYFVADEMKGYPAEIEMRDITMSSCSFDCPKEYRLTGSRARLKPGRSLEVWNAAAFIYAIPVFYLPYVYLDLHRLKSQVGLRVGSNKTDGKFAYINYTHTAKAFFIGALALVFKEKTGNQYKFDEKFRNKWLGYGEGQILFDTQETKTTKQKNQTYTVRQEIPFSETKKLMLNFTRTSTYQVFSSVRQYNQSSTLEYKSGTRSLKWDDRKNATTGGITRNKTGNYSGKLSFWGVLINVNALNYKSSQSPGKAADEILNLDLGYSSRKGNKILNSYTLQFTRDFDLDGSRFVGDNKQTVNFNFPKATFHINPDLWKKNFFGKWLMIQTVGLAGGGLKQGPRDSANKAGYGDLSIDQTRNIRIGKTINISLGHRFTQSMYDSGDARYTTAPRADLRWDVHPKIRFSVGFQSNSAKGGSPFQIVSSSVSRTANWNLDLGRQSKWTLKIATSYDLKANRKNPISVQYTVNPSRSFSISLGSNYNSVTNQWADLDFKFQLSPEKPISYNGGVRFSLDRSRVLSAQLTTSINMFPRMTIDIQSSWSPTDKDPFVKKVLLTKYNCCTFYEIAYESNKKSVMFNFGITAFPQERLRLSGGDQGLLFNPPGQGLFERGIGG